MLFLTYWKSLLKGILENWICLLGHVERILMERVAVGVLMSFSRFQLNHEWQFDILPLSTFQIARFS